MRVMNSFQDDTCWDLLEIPNHWERVPHVNTKRRENHFHIGTWKKVSNLYNI